MLTFMGQIIYLKIINDIYEYLKLYKFVQISLQQYFIIMIMKL